MATEAGPSPVRSEPPTLPEVAAAFPQLEVLGLIGSGGMGYVFRVRQQALGREAALKLLPRHLAAAPTFVERFNREARTLARLSHPNIVNVYESGQTGGFCYLLMEYVDGANLRQAMRAGKFTPAQALAIIPRICDALQYAHTQGVLHRDIKPENILIDARGEVKIADFGIAKLVDDPVGVRGDITLTQSGVRLGTPHYMAPEQIEKPDDVDHRADIYSLGVVFYELLTGELPLGRFPAPSEKAALDARIDEIVFRALAKERDLRQQSAGEVRKQVEGLSEKQASRPALSEAVVKRQTAFRRPVFWFLLAASCFLAGFARTALLPWKYGAVAHVEAIDDTTLARANSYVRSQFAPDSSLEFQVVAGSRLVEIRGWDTEAWRATRHVEEAIERLQADPIGESGKIRIVDPPVSRAVSQSRLPLMLGSLGLLVFLGIGLTKAVGRSDSGEGGRRRIPLAIPGAWACAVLVSFGFFGLGLGLLIRRSPVPDAELIQQQIRVARMRSGINDGTINLTRTERFVSSNEVRLRWEIRAPHPGNVRLSFLDQSQTSPLLRHQIGDYRAVVSVTFERQSPMSVAMAAYIESHGERLGASRGEEASELLAKAVNPLSGDLILQVNTPVWLTHLGDAQVIMEVMVDNVAAAETSGGKVPPQDPKKGGGLVTRTSPLPSGPSDVSGREERIARNTMLLAELGQLDDERASRFLSAVYPSQELSTLIDQRNFAARQIAGLGADFGTDHPEMVKWVQHVKQIDLQLKQTIRGITDGIRFNLEADKAALKASSGPELESALKQGRTLERSAANGLALSIGDLAKGFRAANDRRDREALRVIQPVVSDAIANPDKEYVFRSDDELYEVKESKIGGILAVQAILAARTGDAETLSKAQAEGARLWSKGDRLALYEIRLGGATDQNWDEVITQSSDLLALKAGDLAKVTVVRHFKEYGKSNTTNVVEGLWIPPSEPANGKAQIYGGMNATISLERGKPVWVSDAILSGGRNEMANLKKVTIHRRDSTKVVLNVDKILKENDRSGDLQLMDGDRVEVPERKITF